MTLKQQTVRHTARWLARLTALILLVFSYSPFVLSDSYPAVSFFVRRIFVGPGPNLQAVADQPTMEAACAADSNWGGPPPCGQWKITVINGVPWCNINTNKGSTQCYWQQTVPLVRWLTCPGGGTINGTAYKQVNALDTTTTTICGGAPACTPKARNLISGKCELPAKTNGPSPCIDHGNPINSGTGNNGN